MLPIRIKSLHPDATLPEVTSSSFDLCAVVGYEVILFIEEGEAQVVGTGWSFEVPLDYVMLVFGGVGRGSGEFCRLSNMVGVIDSGYRGEVKCKLVKDRFVGDAGDLGGKWEMLCDGDVVGRGVVLKREEVNFVVVDDGRC